MLRFCSKKGKRQVISPTCVGTKCVTTASAYPIYNLCKEKPAIRELNFHREERAKKKHGFYISKIIYLFLFLQLVGIVIGT